MVARRIVCLPYRPKSPPPPPPTGIGSPSACTFGPQPLSTTGLGFGLGPGPGPGPASSPPAGPQLPATQYNSGAQGVVEDIPHGLPNFEFYDSDDDGSQDDSFESVQRSREVPSYGSRFCHYSSACSKCADWEDEAPVGGQHFNLIPPGVNAEDLPFCIGYIRTLENTWKVGHIWIYDMLLLATLAPLFEAHPYINVASMENPAYFFVQNWLQFTKLTANESNMFVRGLLEDLRSVLMPQLTTGFEAFKCLQATGHISYDDLRLAFIPGDPVICKADCGAVVVGLLGGMSRVDGGASSHWRVEVSHFDWDGVRPILKTETYEIGIYGGTRRIDTLPMCPLDLHPEKAFVKACLIKRGRKLESFRLGVHFMRFRGRARDPDNSETHANSSHYSIYTDERVIIGTKYYHDHEWTFPSRNVGADMLNAKDVIARAQSKSYRLSYHQCRRLEPLQRSIPICRSEYLPRDIPPIATPWTDEQCLMAVPEIRCYVPSVETWYLCKVDNLEPIPWVLNAMQPLAIDELGKALIHAALKNFARVPVHGEREVGGIAMLLSGGTGTGKSMTIDCGCEAASVVPYRFDVPSVVNLPTDFERELVLALRRCEAFKVPLVIDHAHNLFVKPEEGAISSLITTIFLQMLERFKGVVLLTTDNENLLDPAVKAHTDLRLDYNDLNRCARYNIWLGKLLGQGISKEDIALIAIHTLNGHQIDSVMKLATLMKGPETCLNARLIHRAIEAHTQGVIVIQPEAAIGLDTVM